MSSNNSNSNQRQRATQSSNQQSSASGNKGNKGNNSANAEETSTSRLIKDGGYRNMNDFMLSYGLRMGEPDDHEEARQILEGMRRIDREQGK